MNPFTTARAAGLVALMVSCCPYAHAGVVLDGWQLFTNTGTTTHIGRLNLGSSQRTLEQQVDGTGNVFVNAKFESNAVYDILQYTMENVVGPGDTSPAQFLSDHLTLSFSNVRGTVTALNAGGGYRYRFDSGDFFLAGIAGIYATGALTGDGGDISSTFVSGGFEGDSILTASISAIASLAFDLRDSSSSTLKPDLASAQAFFEVRATDSSSGLKNVGSCSFNTAARCLSGSVASSGNVFLADAAVVPDPGTEVPEPGSFALLGLAFLCMRAARRGRAAPSY